jgi:Domain of unknown function (DUF4386)
MVPNQKLARFTGAVYLVCVFTAPFSLIYVPSRVIVHGDATATAQRILSLEGLFRAGIAVNLVSGIAFMAAVLLLYWLLQGVAQIQASFMALLGLIFCPLGLFAITCDLAALRILQRADFLSVFSQAQTEQLAMLVFGLREPAVVVTELFWGLWLFPCGWLVIRSRFLPRILGWLLIANGVAYVVLSFTGVLFPSYGDAMMRMTMPLMFGELWLALWLVFMGIKRPSLAMPPAET